MTETDGERGSRRADELEARTDQETVDDEIDQQHDSYHKRIIDDEEGLKQSADDGKDQRGKPRESENALESSHIALESVGDTGA